ncbi:MAG: hypothetical protein HKN04_06995 [Rhodothermaceae bacterium]|nr:hypothetical protein [Rhodothermaceae bacterium]
MQSFRIEDPLDQPSQGAVEVVVTMDDGSERWCCFFDPDRLALVGDLVEGTTVRLHLGVQHMIVVSELSQEIIERVLRQLDGNGELLNHTLAVSGRAVEPAPVGRPGP